jgi:hypothetical protein
VRSEKGKNGEVRSEKGKGGVGREELRREEGCEGWVREFGSSR